MTAPLTPDDLAAIEAREQAATAGPWTWRVSEDRRWVDIESPHIDRVVATTHDDDTADFIAHARTDVPRLLAHVKAQAERIAELEALVSRSVAKSALDSQVAEVTRLRERLAQIDTPATVEAVAEALAAESARFGPMVSRPARLAAAAVRAVVDTIGGAE